ncbi:HET-domain-containing protein [Ganoderma leucocontextum]|nr:HET-domain-containing protein [Ganoderma leucocontextum]
MWVLSTDRAELQWFANAGAVIGGYAILSHTWGEYEQTFEDLRAISELCKASGKIPRDVVTSKIRECCRMAETYGYRWLWVDTCCIDKFNATELSEAINSMFQWYWQAEVCYAFLADVPSGCELQAEKSAFRESRWHTRGWTLQELIAPAVVIFLSGDWVRLGTKAELAPLLEEITRIPQAVLVRQKYYHQCSVANRMLWAANRTTTLEEDQSYCLMGLFDVTMTIIYGEGKRAFQRLQNKIMKHGFDLSLFAWGGWISDATFASQGLELNPDGAIDPFGDSSYLLAPSPDAFIAGCDFMPLGPAPAQQYPPPPVSTMHRSMLRPRVTLFSQQDAPISPSPGCWSTHLRSRRFWRRTEASGNANARRSAFDKDEIPNATLEKYGVVCRVPAFESDGVVVAVLFCVNETHEHLGLLLRQDPQGYDPLFYTGAAFSTIGSSDRRRIPVAFRLVTLGRDFNNLRFNGKPFEPKWRTLHVHSRPPPWFSPDRAIARLQLNSAERPPFRIPHWLIAQLTALGFLLMSPPASKFNSVPLRLTLSDAPHGELIHLDLGLCHPSEGGSRPPSHWAKVVIDHEGDTSRRGASHDVHDCREHHVHSWEGRSRVFGDPETRGVRLSFTPCPLTPAAETLVVHIELVGAVYDGLGRLAELGLGPGTREERGAMAGDAPSGVLSFVAGTTGVATRSAAPTDDAFPVTRGQLVSSIQPVAAAAASSTEALISPMPLILSSTTQMQPPPPTQASPSATQMSPPPTGAPRRSSTDAPSLVIRSPPSVTKPSSTADSTPAMPDVPTPTGRETMRGGIVSWAWRRIAATL